MICSLPGLFVKSTSIAQISLIIGTLNIYKHNLSVVRFPAFSEHGIDPVTRKGVKGNFTARLERDCGVVGNICFVNQGRKI